MDVSVHDDRASLSRAAADRIARRAASGPMTLGLAGGSTPAGTYAALRDHGIVWSGVSLWLSDERWVPHDHADSNGRMALEHLPSPAAERLARPRWSPWLEPADSAAHYEAVLRSLHPEGRADLVLLGMGDDGHTASLFPGTAGLDAEPGRWFVANHVPQLATWRLTATGTFLQAAHEVLVLVAGGSKARVLAEVIEGPDGVHPVQLLRKAQGSVTFLCDREAASALS